MSNVAIMVTASNSVSAANSARKRKEEDCKVFMSSYTDATASDQMKKTYASCVEEVVPKDFSHPSVEAKIAVTAIFFGWILFMIVGGTKRTIVGNHPSLSDRIMGGGTFWHSYIHGLLSCVVYCGCFYFVYTFLKGFL